MTASVGGGGATIERAMATKASRQIVIGPARTGFALLLSVLAHLSPLRARKSTLRKALLELFATRLGDHISEQIVAVFGREGLAEDLVFNRNFRALLGGPRWAVDGRRACYRKYIGARSRGDLMLIVAHPLALFDCDDIIHSHVDPAWWASQTIFPRKCPACVGAQSGRGGQFVLLFSKRARQRTHSDVSAAGSGQRPDQAGACAL